MKNETAKHIINSKNSKNSWNDIKTSLIEKINALATTDMDEGFAQQLSKFKALSVAKSLDSMTKPQQNQLQIFANTITQYDVSLITVNSQTLLKTKSNDIVAEQLGYSIMQDNEVTEGFVTDENIFEQTTKRVDKLYENTYLPKLEQLEFFNTQTTEGRALIDHYFKALEEKAIELQEVSTITADEKKLMQQIQDTTTNALMPLLGNLDKQVLQK